MNNEMLMLTNGGAQQLQRNTMLGKSQFEILQALASKSPIEQILIQHKRAQDKINDLISMGLVEKKAHQAHVSTHKTSPSRPKVEIPVLSDAILAVPNTKPAQNAEHIDLAISQQDKAKVRKIIDFYDHASLNGEMTQMMDACFKDANSIKQVNDILEAFSHKMKKGGRHGELKMAASQIKTINPHVVLS